MDRNLWQSRLIMLENDFGYQGGFKFLYCPWSTIGTARQAFISLNPGNPPDNVDLRTISDERGNSYVVERSITRSPITEQFLKLCELVNVPPEQMLTGVAAPFRTPKWVPSRDKKTLPIGREFWEDVFQTQPLETIFCLGREAENLIVSVRGASLVQEVNSGWGDYKIRKYTDATGCIIIGLLHLSTFKLLSRDQCREKILSLLT